jgi:hypothetical protein
MRTYRPNTAWFVTQLLFAIAHVDKYSCLRVSGTFAGFLLGILTILFPHHDDDSKQVK